MQEGGTFRLQRGPDDALFAHTVGHDSLKRLLFPPVVQVWHGPPRRPALAASRSRRRGTRSSACARATCTPSRSRTACSSATATSRRTTRARRRDAFFVAVQLRARGRDVLLRVDGHGPAGTRRLRPRADRAPRRAPATASWSRSAATAVPRSSPRWTRGRPIPTSAARRTRPRRARGPRWAAALDTTDLRDLLFANAEHPRWDDVADRCLSCGNCTMVCPTCFCSAVRGHDRPRRRRGGPDAGCGTRASPSGTPTLHGGSVRRTTRVALPAVDDPQARDLDRPVRHLGLRRLRALHHLVPGRHRHHRGGGGDPATARRRDADDRGAAGRAAGVRRAARPSTA